MPIFALFLYLFFPTVAYMGIDYALTFKGCITPKESYKIAGTFLVADVILKAALLPVFTDPSNYIMVCIIIDVLILGYDLVNIYWRLNRQDIRIIKKFPSNVNYTLLAIKFMLAFGFCVVFESIIVYNSWYWSDPSELLMYIILCDFIIFLSLIFISMQLVRLDRIKIPAMRSLHSLKSKRPPILLLRSFELDKYPWWNNKTFDEELCSSIDMNDSPVISLSDPDQLLPTGGSLKIQSKDDYWKSIIEELIKSCRAIVIIEGDSNGLSWEIERIKDIYQTHPDKIFFYVPSNRYRVLAWCINDQGGPGIFRNLTALLLKLSSPIKIRKQLKYCWHNFNCFIQSKGFKIISEYPGPDSLIAFDKNGNPTVISKKDSSELFGNVLDRTRRYIHANYDYMDLAKKIEYYEVNGFVTELQMNAYRAIGSKLSKINNAIACALLVLGIITWFII